MQNLSDYECLVISHWFNAVARVLSSMATADGLSDQQVAQLTNISDSLADDAANLATQVAQTTFTDAAAAFRQISDIASQANTTATQLSKSIANANAVMQIGAKMIGLGAAIVTGNFGGAVSDLIGLVGTPTPGQGANIGS